MKMPRVYYGILAVFCIVTICIGLASAAGAIPFSANRTHERGPMHPAFDLTNTTLQQQMIARFQQQGIDVSGLQAAFQSGNFSAVKEWMMAHGPAHHGRQQGHARQG